jgi:hypothetical protein
MAPAVLTVNSVADTTTPGTMLTLREAIELVDGTLGRALTAGEQAQVSGTLGSNDTIQFSLPAGPQTITLTNGELDLTRAVTINGPGAANLTIDGNHQSRVFTVGTIFTLNRSLVVSMSGLTVADGSTPAPNDYGAGLLNFGTLSLNHMAFTGNTAGPHGGGAIYNVGSLTLSNSTLTNNSTGGGGGGGGIDNIGSGLLTVSNCTFAGNSAGSSGQGGGMANSGTATVSDCTYAGNSADSDGGGIFNGTAGTLTVSDCTFTNNTTGADGGGILQDGTATVTGSTFSGNSAGSEGGAIDNNGTLLRLLSCTLYGNSAVSDGGGLKTSGPAQVVNCTITANRVTVGAGGIFGGGIDDQGTAATLTNTIVAGNFQGAAPSTTANDIAGTVGPGSSNNLIGTGGSGGLANGSNQNQVGVANPGLGTLTSNGGPTRTVALLPGSPAIDAGNDSVLGPPLSLSTDQRGRPRRSGSHVDIGAFELQPGRTSPPAITSAGSVTFTVGKAGTFTVTASGVPTPTFRESGALPSGVKFIDNGDGTATLTGTPAAASAGTYILTITAHNGAGSDATQTFILRVLPPPPPPVGRPITAKLVPASVKVGKKKVIRLLVELFLRGSKKPERVFLSPFQAPVYKNIHVSVVAGNGATGLVVVRANSGKMAVAQFFVA